MKMMEVMMAKKKKLSQLTEDLHIYPQVLVNVMVKDKAVAQADADVQAAISKVAERLGDTGRKKVAKFSLGMRQRLAIAQAIMEKPKLIILDEPMNGLDKRGVEEMRQIFLNLKAEGTTILLASHNMEDIRCLCDKVYEMDAGVLTPIDGVS